MRFCASALVDSGGKELDKARDLARMKSGLRVGDEILTWPSKLIGAMLE